MRKVVIDTSIFVNSCIAQNERIFKSCFEIVKNIEEKKYQAFSTELMKVEVANALKYSDYNQERMKEFLAGLYELRITWIEIEQPLLEAATSRSIEVGDTVYDALYHVTAQALDATFLTCDKKYYDRAKHYGDIELIG